MHAFDHGPELRGHEAGRLSSRYPEGMHSLFGSEFEAPSGAGSRREYPHRGAGMPPLPDMLLAHAHPHTRPDLITRDRGGQEFAPGETRVRFGNGDESGQGDGADVEHALPMHVV